MRIVRRNTHEYILGILRWWHDYRYAIRDCIICIGVLLLSGQKWGKKQLEGRKEKVALTMLTPNSYTMKKKRYDAMTEDMPRIE